MRIIFAGRAFNAPSGSGAIVPGAGAPRRAMDISFQVGRYPMSELVVERWGKS